MNSLKITSSNNRLQRSDLLHLLDHSQAFSLTLILAPAGSGKSTLLQQWRIQNTSLAIAYLGLSRRDKDPIVFLRHFYHCLQHHINISPVLSLNALDASSEQAEILAQSLLEAFDSYDKELFLILDDFHYSDTTVISPLFAYLLTHLPAHIHLIIASRSHPDFSLSKLKLEDQLLLVDSHDLRLPATQINELCQILQQPNLSQSESDELLRLTEGWMAGIKLALMARAKTGQLFPKHFQGTQPEIVDYFIDVVLAELDVSLREFLLASSILKHFDAKTMQHLLPHLDSQQLIQRIIQKGLFISVFDEQAQSYRYHPLFKRCLRVRLQQEPATYTQHLHHRAADYFLVINDAESALFHAQLLSESQHFYYILAQCCTQWLKEGKLDLILSWLNRLDSSERLAVPELALLHLSALIFSRHFADAQYQLQYLKTHYETHTQESIISTLTVLENIFNLFHQDTYQPEPAIFQAENNRHYDDIRDAALTFLARYFMLQGECETAIRYAMRGKILLTKLHHNYLSSFSDVILILSERELGHIVISRQMTQEFFERYAQQPQTPCWVNASTCMAVSLYEQNRSQEAKSLCEQLMMAMDSACATELVFHVYVILARLQTHNSLHKATQLFMQLRRILRQGEYHRLLNQLLAEELSHALYHQQKDVIKSIIHDYGLVEKIQRGTWHQAPSHYQEGWVYGGVAAALYLRSRKQYDKALSVLSTVADNLAGSQMRTRLVVVRANQIVILNLQEQYQQAQQLLMEVFSLVGLQCCLRTVFDEAPDFARIIREANEQGVIKLPNTYLEAYKEILYPTITTIQPHKNQINALTQKEHEILVLVQKGLSNKEICQQLSISLSTVKWHIKNIFSKLQISNRAAAISYYHLKSNLKLQ